MGQTAIRGFLAGALTVVVVTSDVHAAVFAAQVNVTGTDSASTAAVVLHQTAGPQLEVATSPPNLGDLSLLLGGAPMSQAAGVIIANPNQFQYASVSDRNIIETPGELTTNVPPGFPNGTWLSTTSIVGFDGSEANFRLSLVRFLFADGWRAGHVSRNGVLLAGNGPGVTISHLPNLPNSSFGQGHYRISIAGVNSLADGMLFGMSEINDASGNAWQAGALPDGNGWDIRINDQSQNFPFTEQHDWSFVYVPYSTPNLFAAGRLSLVSDTTLNVLNRVGSFTAKRADIGRFLIQIPGKDDSTGVLMVGVSKYTTISGQSGADDNILAYEYNSALGGFLVDTYDLSGAALEDSDIYFAYFDYSNPIVPEPASVCLAVVGLLALGFHRAVRVGRTGR